MSTTLRRFADFVTDAKNSMVAGRYCRHVRLEQGAAAQAVLTKLYSWPLLLIQ